jgi:hypothetical protein
MPSRALPASRASAPVFGTILATPSTGLARPPCNAAPWRSGSVSNILRSWRESESDGQNEVCKRNSDLTHTCDNSLQEQKKKTPLLLQTIEDPTFVTTSSEVGESKSEPTSTAPPPTSNSLATIIELENIKRQEIQTLEAQKLELERQIEEIDLDLLEINHAREDLRRERKILDSRLEEVGFRNFNELKQTVIALTTLRDNL